MPDQVFDLTDRARSEIDAEQVGTVADRGQEPRKRFGTSVPIGQEVASPLSGGLFPEQTAGIHRESHSAGGIAEVVAGDERGVVADEYVIVICAADARFGAVFMKMGVSNCDMGTSYLLPRLVGASRAAELLLTGRLFDAAEAKAMGLVTDVVPGEELLNRAVGLARRIAEHGTFQLWMTKEAMWQGLAAGNLRQALDMENRTQTMLVRSGAFDEGIATFQSRGT